MQPIKRDQKNSTPDKSGNQLCVLPLVYNALVIFTHLDKEGTEEWMFQAKLDRESLHLLIAQARKALEALDQNWDEAERKK